MPYENHELAFTQADVILLVPPFAAIWQPSLACHLLQACARQQGFNVAVIYGNLIYASMVGRQVYEHMLEEGLLLEHIFRRQAFGDSANSEGVFRANTLLEQGAKVAETWLARMAKIIHSVAPKIAGCTCSFEQISSSVALLNTCKEIGFGIITIIGGANCEAEMAEGILSLGGQIDFIASGESEESFPSFLEQVLVAGQRPDPIIHGKPCTNLDQLPLPVYDEYFDQYSHYLPDAGKASRRLAVPYESSRGCWWGEKHHCTFCGLNGSTMNHREKSADLVVTELKAISKRYPISQINFVDNIMPHRYFKTLLSQLPAAIPESVSIFYEQKANLTLAKVRALKEAHITTIQPGIESLNSNILNCIDKGIKGHQNIALLRYTRSLGISATWNLITCFPGDQRKDYEEIARLIPLLIHLQPPDGPGRLRIDRFSPYFNTPQRYGIANLRPKAIYADVFPEGTNLNKLAYYFDGDYQCGAFECPEILDDIAAKTLVWRKHWQSKPKPVLSVVHLFQDQFVLSDTRGLPGSVDVQLVNREQATLILTGARLSHRDDTAWALERNLLFEMDGLLIPLATAPPALLMEFESAAVANSPARGSFVNISEVIHSTPEGRVGNARN
jgi:ribosomal peptide maturation radical SAM protein 1